MSDARLVPERKTPLILEHLWLNENTTSLLMDPSDFFGNAPLQRSREHPCSFYQPSCQEPPRHSLVQHLPSAMPRQPGRMHHSNMSIQRNQEHILDRQHLTESNILGVKKKRMNNFNWNQNASPEKKIRSESHDQSENIGRKKRKDRDELKEQVGELKERLVTLQEKVWMAFGQKHWSQNERRWRYKDELTGKSKGADSEGGPFANISKKHTWCQGPKGELEEAVEKTLWWNCTELSRGESDGEQDMAVEGRQQFAQLLKVELRNAVVRVIDRVLTIYTEASGPELSFSPPPAVAFVDKPNDKWGILKTGSKRANEVGGSECYSTARQSSVPAEVGAVRIQLPPLRQSFSSAHLSKDPSLPSHSCAPLAPPYPPPHPLQLMDPLPLLHYSMQQLFSSTLSHVPMLQAKNFHENREPLAELDQAIYHPPMPLFGLLEPTLSGPLTDRESGRRAEVSTRGAGGALDLYFSASGSQEGLSPCHLKKAKLLFFYTRYPSSSTLKTYFPDVKWFENMDVGHTSRDRRLRVGQDTELYRVLNMHYNKSNVYQVPDGFIKISEVALREFYAALWTGRDSDPCWKKAIYKMICKLDSPVPDAFRLPGCPVG
ncbi:prospero homeobox 3 [Eucyclogobius newberryi]|uniref:prospero homeobox 3 n=1 Tax=Eucyclogobius newberryi TaxID=166745 RepID=UPI003B5B17A5